jgi:hypothetical protein
MQLKASHEVMREDGELEPGAVGAVVIGGHHVEGKFALEFGEGLFLRAAAGGEGPQGLRGKRGCVMRANGLMLKRNPLDVRSAQSFCIAFCWEGVIGRNRPRPY